MKQIIWDWNGTLLDDTQAALDALNIMLARRGCAAIEMDFYRDNFAFPARNFYRQIGMKIDSEDWDALAKEYHDLYSEQPKRLNLEAVAALERVRAAGARQAVVSALRQDLLDAAMAEYGIAPYMDYVYGTDNLDGASKLDRARELLAKIGADGAVMIGDALHDKEVADALGVPCVLCAQGSHAAWRLRAVAPTTDTLLDAVCLVLSQK